MIRDFEYVLLAQAHVLIGVSRSTVYRWYAEGRLTAFEEGEVGKGMHLIVRAGEVRELHSRLRRNRHAGRRVAPD
ncbi:hypothetical protein [Microbacterium sp. KR10-403]|uniref:hypothetical protein n=1 Tax=Microbacterium sp. KR10-403 TaxID=3158581 RepID=UPI0032E4F927